MAFSMPPSTITLEQFTTDFRPKVATKFGSVSPDSPPADRRGVACDTTVEVQYQRGDRLYVFDVTLGFWYCGRQIDTSVTLRDSDLRPKSHQFGQQQLQVSIADATAAVIADMEALIELATTSGNN